MSKDEILVCAGCGKDVDLTKPHISIDKHVEVFDGDSIKVFRADNLYFLCLSCGEGFTSENLNKFVKTLGQYGLRSGHFSVSHWHSKL